MRVSRNPPFGPLSANAGSIVQTGFSTLCMPRNEIVLARHLRLFAPPLPNHTDDPISLGVSTNRQNPKVDAFVGRAKAWRGEIQKLRSILLDCGLDEDLKWGKPCFQFEGKNVAIIQPFKAHCALMFFKGALFQDTHGLLRSQGENTQAALRLEFTSVEQVTKTLLQAYVKQAIAVEKSGAKVDFKAKRDLVYPEELTQSLKQDRRLAKAFDALTPGRRRAYVLHFAGAKQSQTRRARIEKCIPKILAGMGITDH